MRLALPLLASLLLVTPALAMIQVGLGNKPVDDHNWPAGALEVANLKTRLGWWEGPPFGGGQWQFLYRGDAADFQAALDQFGKIRAPELRLVIREGPHQNQFLKDSTNPKADTRVDWTLTVWDPRSWNQLYNNPKQTVFADEPTDRFRRPVESPVLELYAAGPDGKGIDFAKLKIPPNVKVSDERATSAGYARDATPVIRGDVYDTVTSKPVAKAELVIEKATGRDAWERVASARADADGRFELTPAPAGPHRVVVVADGYVPRLLGHVSLGANELKTFVVRLAPAVQVGGTVTGTDGKPMAGVKVRAEGVMASDGRGYPLIQHAETTTDAQGRFTLTGLPAGHTQFRATLPAFQHLDILALHATPADDVALKMTATGTVVGRVLQGNGIPAGAGTHVSIDPPGDPIGKWGGSMQVKPDGTFRFDDVPPGPYSISTNPLGARNGKDSKATTIEVKASETLEVNLTK